MADEGHGQLAPEPGLALPSDPTKLMGNEKNQALLAEIAAQAPKDQPPIEPTAAERVESPIPSRASGPVEPSGAALIPPATTVLPAGEPPDVPAAPASLPAEAGAVQVQEVLRLIGAGNLADLQKVPGRNHQTRRSP